jgi:hypothetical protein
LGGSKWHHIGGVEKEEFGSKQQRVSFSIFILYLALSLSFFALKVYTFTLTPIHPSIINHTSFLSLTHTIQNWDIRK